MQLHQALGMGLRLGMGCQAQSAWQSGNSWFKANAIATPSPNYPKHHQRRIC
jgi:hypothetical protein